MIKSDYLVIGSGIAGLSFALKGAKCGTVSLITKRKLFDSSTSRAQGGIACVTDRLDTFEEHVGDTLSSGAGLCNKEMVEKMVKESSSRIRELVELGVKFTKKDEFSFEFDLGLEGGHSKRRVLHAGDVTGAEIEKILISNVYRFENITVYEEHAAVDLILDDNNFCSGARVLNNENSKVEVFQAKVVVLACGGSGKTYLYTSNPDVATGDGIAMAYRAGADIANMEFVQFHPTCLYNGEAKSFLISEAVRGEGAVLRLKNGEQFMDKYSSQKELAPRDIVSRAIDTELKARRENFVYLDITSKSRDFLVRRFPNIYAKCLEYGIDMAKDMIPVTPAAHFFCGGINIDEHGRASIENLYAIGETACSGIHGANRLASNSLLEGIVYADRVYKDSLKLLNREHSKINDMENKINNFKKLSQVSMQEWEEIRRLAWSYLGIYRSNEKLLKAKKRIDILKNEIDKYFVDTHVSVDSIELRNITCVAKLILRSAMLRKESRGLHFNVDYPFMLSEAYNTILNINKKETLYAVRCREE
ncbi:MAG: L-aspartate oxidase [Endomicrobium sp.]|jgi:L-aspartate oxidase|nr:L-aspartate oxidase [Endomicrobium sp.]